MRFFLPDPEFPNFELKIWKTKSKIGLPNPNVGVPISALVSLNSDVGDPIWEGVHPKQVMGYLTWEGVHRKWGESSEEPRLDIAKAMDCGSCPALPAPFRHTLATATSPFR